MLVGRSSVCLFSDPDGVLCVVLYVVVVLCLPSCVGVAIVNGGVASGLGGTLVLLVGCSNIVWKFAPPSPCVGGGWGKLW